MTAQFDTAYYRQRAAEIEKKSKGAARFAASRVRFLLNEAQHNGTPILDVMDALQEESESGAKSAYSKKLREAVDAIRQRRDLSL